MSRATLAVAGAPGRLVRAVGGERGAAVRLLALLLLDAFAAWFLRHLVADGVWFLAGAIAVVTLGLNVVFLVDALAPIRWLSPGLALMVLLVVYPVLFTGYVAFTNYSGSHVLTRAQALRSFASETFLPAGASTYRWAAFRSPAGRYALWLVGEDGRTLLARPGEAVQPAAPGQAGAGPADPDGFPEILPGYRRLTRVDAVRSITELSQLEFGRPPDVFRISSLDRAAEYQPKYALDPVQDALIDRETGDVYRSIEGTFTSNDGAALTPAFQAVVGLRNVARLLGDPAVRGPVVQIFVWTVAFALVTVASQFALGLVLALALNDPIVPPRLTRAIRAVLLLPYVAPSFLTILVWRGMLNSHVGVVNRVLRSLVGWAPDWVSDPWGARASVLLVALWLGFPYFLLICTGGLQAIPEDVQEAAEVDGASGWQRFWWITLPMLLTALGPLPLLAFAFNFNNFNVVYLLTEGGPPMENALTPAGYTDLLISYTYKLAFTFGRGADYGFASVITLIIYVAMVAIVFPQLRYGRVWAESARR